MKDTPASVTIAPWKIKPKTGEVGPGIWLLGFIGIMAVVLPFIGDRSWSLPAFAGLVLVALGLSAWKWSQFVKRSEFADPALKSKGGVSVEFSMEHDRGVYYDRGVVWVERDSLRYEGASFDFRIGGQDLDPEIEPSSKAGKTELNAFRAFALLYGGKSRRCGIQVLRFPEEKDETAAEKRADSLDKFFKKRQNTPGARIVPPLVHSAPSKRSK